MRSVPLLRCLAAAVVASALGRPEPNATESAASLVLFSWVYGKAYERAGFRFFLRSVAGCGADVVLLGDPPPSFLDLPANVRAVRVGWSELASSLERLFNAGQPLPELRGAPAEKVSDVKPLTALLVPELVQGYTWWGWCDNDIWLGNVAGLLAEELSGFDADFLSLGPSWGPLSIARNIPAVNALAARRRNRRAVLRVLRSSRYRAFDEWGEPAWGGFGYNSSFSGFLTAAAALGELRLGHRSIGRAVWDGPCLTSNSTTCGFCAMCAAQLPPGSVAGRAGTAAEVMPNGVGRRAAATRLCALDGSEVLVCHFQYGKDRPWHQRASAAEIDELLEADSIASTYMGGIFRFPRCCRPSPRMPP